MKNIHIISEDDTKKLLHMEDVISTIEGVYREKSTGTGEIFPMVFHEFEPGVADMDIKSGTLSKLGVYGLKLVSWFGENPSKNLPALSGVVMIFDSKTGLPLAVINAENMTGMRTGAAGAIGAKYMANPDSTVMLMVGAGHQASYQIRAMQLVMPKLSKVMIFDPLNFSNAEKFAENFEYKKDGIIYEPVNDIETAVGISDIIVTATPSRTPLIKREWIKKGTHFSCMGSDMSGKQEIDENILCDAKLVTDDMNQSVNVGEFEIGIAKGVISRSDIICEIGDVMEGKKTVRTSKEDITVYDSTGIALQDIAVAYNVLKNAQKMEIGNLAEF